MVNYVENVFKNCELFPTTLDMKSSLHKDQESIIDAMAKEIADDVAAYPDPNTLI